MLPRTGAILASLLLAVAVQGAAAQEVFLDRDGVWRYVDPPGLESGPTFRQPPPVPEMPADEWGDDPGAHLRGLVPSYDEPWPDPGPERRDGWARVAPDERGDRWRAPGGGERMRRDGYFDQGIDLDPPEWDGGADGWAAGRGLDAEPGYAPGAGLDLDAAPAVPPSPDLVDGLARYAAAKRRALRTDEPAARLEAIRRANAWLVSLSGGPASTASIRAVDAAFGLTSDLAEAANLPGAGTSVERPGVEPGEDDLRIARALATGEPVDLPADVVAEIDGFLGHAGGGAVFGER